MPNPPFIDAGEERGIEAPQNSEFLPRDVLAGEPEPRLELSPWQRQRAGHPSLPAGRKLPEPANEVLGSIWRLDLGDGSALAVSASAVSPRLALVVLGVPKNRGFDDLG